VAFWWLLDWRAVLLISQWHGTVSLIWREDPFEMSTMDHGGSVVRQLIILVRSVVGVICVCCLLCTQTFCWLTCGAHTVHASWLEDSAQKSY
jgi:hypothetical protein